MRTWHGIDGCVVIGADVEQKSITVEKLAGHETHVFPLSAVRGDSISQVGQRGRLIVDKWAAEEAGWADR